MQDEIESGHIGDEIVVITDFDFHFIAQFIGRWRQNGDKCLDARFALLRKVFGKLDEFADKRRPDDGANLDETTDLDVNEIEQSDRIGGIGNGIRLPYPIVSAIGGRIDNSFSIRFIAVFYDIASIAICR